MAYRDAQDVAEHPARLFELLSAERVDMLYHFIARVRLAEMEATAARQAATAPSSTTRELGAEASLKASRSSHTGRRQLRPLTPADSQRVEVLILRLKEQPDPQELLEVITREAPGLLLHLLRLEYLSRSPGGAWKTARQKLAVGQRENAMPRFAAGIYEGWVQVRTGEQADSELVKAHLLLRQGTLLLTEGKPSSADSLKSAISWRASERSPPYGLYPLGHWGMVDSFSSYATDNAGFVVLERRRPVLMSEHASSDEEARPLDAPANAASAGGGGFLERLWGHITGRRGQSNESAAAGPTTGLLFLRPEGSAAASSAGESGGGTAGVPRLAMTERAHVGPTSALQSLRQRLHEAVKQARDVDKFVIRPNEKRQADDDEEEQMLMEDEEDDLPDGEKPGDRADGPTLRFVMEGFLLRRTSQDRQWARRYFVLSANGTVAWFASPAEAHSQHDAYGNARFASPEVAYPQRGTPAHELSARLVLRFFAVHRLEPTADGRWTFPDNLSSSGEGGDSSGADGDGVYWPDSSDDADVEQMLGSCERIELRTGSECVQLASDAGTTSHWLSALRVHALLSYHKAPAFAPSKASATTPVVKVEWMDGKPGRWDAMKATPGRTVQEVVEGMCRLRFRLESTHALEWKKLFEEWSLFEVQTHPRTGELPLHKLDGQLLLQEQVLLSWEEAVRREYGAAPMAPAGAFRLVLRKTVGAFQRPQPRYWKCLSADERDDLRRLDFCQARSDVSGERFKNLLSVQESYDLAVLLAQHDMWMEPSRHPAARKRIEIRMKLGKPPPKQDELEQLDLAHLLPAHILANPSPSSSMLIEEAEPSSSYPRRSSYFPLSSRSRATSDSSDDGSPSPYAKRRFSLSGMRSSRAQSPDRGAAAVALPMYRGPMLEGAGERIPAAHVLRKPAPLPRPAADISPPRRSSKYGSTGGKSSRSWLFSSPSVAELDSSAADEMELSEKVRENETLARETFQRRYKNLLVDDVPDVELEQWASLRVSTEKLVMDLRNDRAGESYTMNAKASMETFSNRMCLEPLSFGTPFSVQLWSSRLRRPTVQPAYAIVDHKGLHIYSWTRSPTVLCRFGFSLELGAGRGPDHPPHVLLGWQLFKHNKDSDFAGGGNETPNGSGSGSTPAAIESQDAEEPRPTRAHATSLAVHVLLCNGKSRDRATLFLLTHEGNEIKKRLDACAEDFQRG